VARVSETAAVLATGKVVKESRGVVGVPGQAAAKTRAVSCSVPLVLPSNTPWPGPILRPRSRFSIPGGLGCRVTRSGLPNWKTQSGAFFSLLRPNPVEGKHCGAVHFTIDNRATAANVRGGALFDAGTTKCPTTYSGYLLGRRLVQQGGKFQRSSP